MCCVVQQRNKAKRGEKAGVRWWRRDFTSVFYPQISAVLQFFSPPITSVLSNYFLSRLKSSLEPVYTLTLPINTSFQISIIIIDCNCQIKSQFLLHFSG